MPAALAEEHSPVRYEGTMQLREVVEGNRSFIEWSATLHTELKRRGVTLQLLHHEYRERHPDGYGYTQFCDHYRRWCQDRRLSMRQLTGSPISMRGTGSLTSRPLATSITRSVASSLPPSEMPNATRLPFGAGT